MITRRQLFSRASVGALVALALGTRTKAQPQTTTKANNVAWLQNRRTHSLIAISVPNRNLAYVCIPHDDHELLDIVGPDGQVTDYLGNVVFKQGDTIPAGTALQII